MISWFRKLWRDKRGNALLIMGAALPMIVGVPALQAIRSSGPCGSASFSALPNSAAIAGVYTRQSAAGSTSGVSAAVTHDLTLNDHNWMSLSSVPTIT